MWLPNNQADLDRLNTKMGELENNTPVRAERAEAAQGGYVITGPDYAAALALFKRAQAALAEEDGI